MKPAYAIYLLQVEWSWDHANIEVATLTLEGKEGARYETEFEKLLDPAFPETEKRHMLAKLQDVAKTLGRAQQGDVDMVRLYRVEDAVGILFNSQHAGKNAPGGLATLQLQLRPICEFDRDGKPVPVPAQGEARASG